MPKSKQLSSRQLKSEIKKNVSSQTYEDEGRMSALHEIDERGHSVQFVQKSSFQPPASSLQSIITPPDVESFAEVLNEEEIYPSKIAQENEQTQVRGVVSAKENLAHDILIKTRRVIESFMGAAPKLQDLIMDQYDNTFAHEQCACGRGKRLVRCHDCFQHPTTCAHCFIEQHRRMPFHWALVWDESKLYFTKRDYAAVLDDDQAVQLGHSDEYELCEGAHSSVKFYVVHTNGIHASRFRFCECLGAPDKVTQLLHARLFPATLDQPKTAFTFTILKQFSMHNIQSKCGAFDFMLSLRRLTDNKFTEDVPVSPIHYYCSFHLLITSLSQNAYKSLLRVSRVWEHITTKKRVGQLHGIDKYLQHRPPGNIVVYCPACPEAGVNMSEKPGSLLEELRHLNSISLTVDGNHRCNRYTKNTDAHDTSLWDGSGYFPNNKYKEYLDGIPVTSEVCTTRPALPPLDSDLHFI
jgi:hypothetical protein